ncbi:MAG: putative Glycoside hydrolase 15-related protein [Candidatus Saccharibacteria bacterium]|nr:putative Glycoside hydrolase 15-related protein [Candidatus Saccharibacteria bacterium]
MARPIVLSNGELHVGINRFGMVHDFYYPYVGLENHSAGKDLRHKVGVWVDGSLSWLDDGEWTFVFGYPHLALVGHTVAKNERLGIVVEFDDVVDSEICALLRNIHVVNLWDQERDIRLFMHQAFIIGDSRSNTDTVQYIPGSEAILHYRGRRAFIVSGVYENQPFDQYTVGLFGIEGHDGTFRDAEDGELSFNNVEHGRVDSTIRFKLTIPPLSSVRVHYWVTAGKSLREALAIHKQIKEHGFSTRIKITADWWHEWLEPAVRVAKKISPEYQESFIQSIMIIKSQIDKRGAIIASTDTSLLNYSRDAYSYCWPRDGAYALWPLIRIGYTEEALRFFDFCRKGLHPSGYLMHKYRADGALGSSWHPYIQDGETAPPLQEDETALVLFVFAQFYNLHPDTDVLDDYYLDMVVPMANFLAEYVNHETGLPKPSYDLWEQVYLTTTYTTATVYAALVAAADLAEVMKDNQRSVKWRSAADDIMTAAHKHLYNPERKSFYKGMTYKDGQLHKDATIDVSSIFGSFLFGLFPAGGVEMMSSVETARGLFGMDTGAPGLPRFENDEYRRDDPNITGNVWFITTLWLAQYYIEHDKLEEANEILRWVRDNVQYNTMLGEQINPTTNEVIAPAPLTWSHAEYISTLLDTITGSKK